MPCSYGHLWPLILPNALVFFRIFTLSDHAARKSGTRGEIREDDFSDGITGCLGCLAAQTSGVKNNASALFFTLSSHAARKSGTRGEIREGVFSDGIDDSWDIRTAFLNYPDKVLVTPGQDS